jgi:hypothetical protein
MAPLPFTATAEFPSHGTPSATGHDGGPGFQGLGELERFVREGGVLITLHQATRLAAETGIARELSPLAAGGLQHPGSVVRAKVRRRDHPILYGYPDTTHLFRGNGPLYTVARRDRRMIVLQYGTEPLPDERADAKPGPMLGSNRQRLLELPRTPGDAAPGTLRARGWCAGLRRSWTGSGVRRPGRTGTRRRVHLQSAASVPEPPRIRHGLEHDRSSWNDLR